MAPIKYLITLVSIFVIFCIAVVIYINDVTSWGMPSLEQLENPKQDLATSVFSADGELLDRFAIQKRVSMPYDSIPAAFKNALIATEDREFYNHWGVHLRRVLTAFIRGLTGSSRFQGASTLTMQLSRSLFLKHEYSFKRKIQEVFIAIQIEKKYTKEEILELYTNTVSFGRGAWGLQVASWLYFNKYPSQLTIAECSFLVGLLKAPEKYNGRRGLEIALDRRNLVLNLMYDQQFLNWVEFETAIEEPIVLQSGEERTKVSYLAPHFVEMIRQRLSGKAGPLDGYDLYRDGLTIKTTINSKIQRYANEAIEEHLLEFQKLFDSQWSWKRNKDVLNQIVEEAVRNRADYKAANSSKKQQLLKKFKNDRKYIDSLKNSAATIQTGLVVIDPSNGCILALVGGSPKFMRENPEFKYSLNHATQIRRQAGSAFKPFVYALCLQGGMTPYDTIGCGPYSYQLVTGDYWNPRGSGGCEPGQTVTLMQGLTRSINTVAARLVTQKTSPVEVVSLCRRLGIDSPLMAVPAIALGAGGEVTPLEMTSAFGAFAYNGYHVRPYYLNKIEDKFGNIILEKKQAKKIRDALRKETTWVLTGMLENVVNHGTGYRVRTYLKDVEAAGKTGTTNDNTDAWFVGYSPELVAGVWIGFDNQSIKFGSYGEGGRAAAPIWGRLMSKIYADQSLPYKKRNFDFPRIDTTNEVIMGTFMTESEAESLKKDSVNERLKNSESNKLPRLPRQ